MGYRTIGKVSQADWDSMSNGAEEDIACMPLVRPHMTLANKLRSRLEIVLIENHIGKRCLTKHPEMLRSMTSQACVPFVCVCIRMHAFRTPAILEHDLCK